MDTLHWHWVEGFSVKQAFLCYIRNLCQNGAVTIYSGWGKFWCFFLTANGKVTN